jgi:RNA polymerase sigma factor (sigma-70 family)
MKEVADRVLLDAVANGDSDAWTQLVGLYSGRLLAFAIRQLGRRRAEAEDLVQDTFLVLVQDTARATHIRSLEAFLFLVLRRKIIDFRRRKKAENLTDSQWQGRLLSPAETPSRVASEAEEKSRSEQALAAALATYLDTLKDEDRYRDLAVLELLFVKQCSGKFAAESMELTPVQVSRIKQAALDFLRRQVRDFDPLEDFSVRILWEENLYSCLKRSVLGSYEMGLLGTDLAGFVKFHLETVECPYCQANLEDMRAESAKLPELKARILATSTPFLRRPG